MVPGGRLWIRSDAANMTTAAVQADLDFGEHLAATLWLPTESSPRGAVALLHGAGPGVRTDYIVPVRKAFARAGLATLAWDRPGCGDSPGDWRRQSLEDRADEALAAIALLKSRREL